jgi:very-short-patch-repair endonuclease
VPCTRCMSIQAVLAALGGVAPTQILLERGISRRELARSLDAGHVTRERRGIIASTGAHPDFVAAVARRSRLTCVSAAPHYGLWRVREPGELHLSRGASAGADCTNHRTRNVPVHPRLPLVGPADVLVHVLQCRPEEESVPMVECALRRGDTVREFLDERLPGRRNGRARSALAKVECSADSAVEVVARLILVGAGLSVRAQAELARVGRVDFLVEDFLVVEIDGAAFHSDRAAFRRDRRRNNAAILGGYTVLRFCYEDVMCQQTEFLAQVLAALAGRPIR